MLFLPFESEVNSAESIFLNEIQDQDKKRLLYCYGVTSLNGAKSNAGSAQLLQIILALN